MDLVTTGTDVTIACQQLGSGPPLLLVHGLAASQGFWSPAVLLPLARRHRLILVDLRGHGRSSMPAGGYTPAHLAADLVAVLDHYQVRRADAIGHSYGGVVILAGACRHPDRFGRLVLADSRLRLFQPSLTVADLMGNQRFAAKLGALGIEIPADEKEAGIWLLELLAQPRWRQRRQELAQLGITLPFGGWHGRDSSRAADRWLQLLATTTARRELCQGDDLSRKGLARLANPILCLHGRDTAAAVSARALARLAPAAQARAVPGGHFFPLTHPALFVAAVSGFLGMGAGERRRAIRVARVLGLWLHTEDGTALRAFSRDLSSGGLLVDSPAPLEVGSSVQLQPPVVAGPDLTIPARVVHTRPQGNGFHCGLALDLNPQQRDAWYRLLEPVTANQAMEG